jgi:signal transduction histidine kinase
MCIARNCTGRNVLLENVLCNLIFRIFQTLANESSQRSGIGLALSKRLVEAHGGWIKLDSTAGARGSA